MRIVDVTRPFALAHPARRFAVWLVFAVLVGLTAAPQADARAGGGSSYHGSSSSHSSSSSSSSHSSSSSSGSHSSSYSGGGGGGSMDGGTFLVLLLIIIVVVVGYALMKRLSSAGSTSTRDPDEPVWTPPAQDVVRVMRSLDDGFSEAVFLEWATLLYARFHEARGRGDLDALGPYLDDAVRQLPAREQKPTQKITGVVVGAVRLTHVAHVSGVVQLSARFQANYTALHNDGSSQAYYVEETWRFARKDGVQSRRPDDVESFGCPSCGSPLERTTLGRCGNCGATQTPGAHDWALNRVAVESLELRGPLLTGTVEEQGTDLPTVVSPTLASDLAALMARAGPGSIDRLEERARFIFLNVQEAWSNAQWEKLRPFETESIFQSHRFWIEEYKRQGLRNVLGQTEITRSAVVKAQSDAYYDVVTLRIHAQMTDATVRTSDNHVVAGNPSKLRKFTEYWTFIRRAGVEDSKASNIQCPGCMAPLQINAAGVCEYCQAKLTRGNFDWVLSRIDQDEEYTG